MLHIYEAACKYVGALDHLQFTTNCTTSFTNYVLVFHIYVQK